MNNSNYPSHPWRKRSREFAQHLDALPKPERQRIKAAESAYLAELYEPNGRYVRAAADFRASMAGARVAVDTDPDIC